MSNIASNNIEIREKIRKGLALTFERLLEYKRKNNGVLVFSENGKIVKIKANDIKL